MLIKILRNYEMKYVSIEYLYLQGYAKLKEGKMVKLVTQDIAKRAGHATCFWVSYPNLPRICQVGDRILIDKGAVLLQVTCIR